MIPLKTLYSISMCVTFYFLCTHTHVLCQHTVRQLTNADGLSNNSINCIFEDSEHTVWLGTWDGLNAYNGRDFKSYRYNRNIITSISNNVIRQILERNSDLWIATDYGVNEWNRNTQKFTNYFLGTEHQIPKQEKSYIIGMTAQKTILSYVRQQGFYFFDDKRQDFFPLYIPLTENQVKDFVIDESNNLYLLYENGNLQQLKIALIDGAISISHIQHLEQEHKISDFFMSNNRLILKYSGYLKIIDPKNAFPTTIDLDKTESISQVICQEDNLLISYYEGGCASYNMITKVYTPIEAVLSRMSIFSIYKGSQHILWVGTDGQGLLKMYQHYSSFKTIQTNYPVRAFSQEDSTRILIGTKGDGIKKLDKTTGELTDYLNTKTGLISNSVYAIRKNHSGDIFIGTEGSGVNVLYAKNKRLEKLNLNAGNPYFKAVYSIHFTNHDSLLWLGTSGYGLIKVALKKDAGSYEVQNIEQYTSSDFKKSLNNNVIYSIASGENENELWLGTRGGGISRFNIKNSTFDQLEDLGDISLTNNDVLSLNKSKDGLWIGTSYGLNKLIPEDGNFKIHEYTDREGLINNTIHGVLEEDHSNIWVSTNQGLSHINLNNNHIINYSSKDGMQNDEFSDGAYYKDEEGVFYFGGVSGFNYFSPEEIHLRNLDPTITLSGLRIFNNPQNIAERIKDNTLKLSYDEAYVTFTVIAQDFINNENCEYAYRLLNFSDEWIQNGNNPNITCTRLPSGKYKLEVKATNGDRIWGSKIYNLQVVVAYPWWLSTSAFVAYFLLTLTIVYVTYRVIRNRIRLNKQLLLEHIEKQNQQKMHESKLNFFTNVAHEFFTPLTLIYGPAQHLLEKVELDSYSKRYIQIIKNNADRMQKLISELMEFRKVESGHTPLHPEKIEIKLLVDYITDNYTEIAHENKIDFQIETSNLSEIVTDRNSLEKVIFNLVSNAFKYTPANGSIHINVWQDHCFHMCIKNSGKGLSEKQMNEIFNQFKIFDSSKLAKSTSTGIGLGLAKNITEMLGGTIEVRSKLGVYVEFEINIPPMQVEQLVTESTQENIQPISIIASSQDISILIVEDEKNIRELLKDILAPYYKVFEAENGEDALSKISTNRPDIIISDILMPNLDGFELLSRLKANPETTHIPIINISARTSIDDHINAYQHGTDLYITKPFHPRHVLATVENMISKHATLKEYFNSSRSAITIKDGISVHQDDERLLNEITSFIEKNMDDESLNPNAIADSLGLSKATLYRKLKDVAGKTPSEFVRTIRLNFASRLLITTKLSVSEIMFKSGFTNKSYFYREFAKQFHVSPGEYRNAKT